jgi:hypothetical protein
VESEPRFAQLITNWSSYEDYLITEIKLGVMENLFRVNKYGNVNIFSVLLDKPPFLLQNYKIIVTVVTSISRGNESQTSGEM